MIERDPQWLSTRAGALRRVRALGLARSGRLSEAEHDLAVARELHPTDGSIAADHARVLMRLGRIAACLSALEDAARLGHDPSQVSRMRQSLLDAIECKEAGRMACRRLVQSLHACGRSSVALCTGRDGNPDHTAHWRLRRAHVTQVLVICAVINLARMVMGT